MAVFRSGAVDLLRFTNVSEIDGKEKRIIKLYYRTTRIWLQQLRRMDKNRLLKQAMQYEPKGRRSIRHPRKRWKD
jgi:hypothetical protein